MSQQKRPAQSSVDQREEPQRSQGGAWYVKLIVALIAIALCIGIVVFVYRQLQSLVSGIGSNMAAGTEAGVTTEAPAETYNPVYVYPQDDSAYDVVYPDLKETTDNGPIVDDVSGTVDSVPVENAD